jgi:hypothetical protein
MVRLNKLFRIPYLFRLLDELEQRPGANITRLRILSLIASVLFFVHIAACGWFTFGSLEGFGLNGMNRTDNRLLVCLP